MACIESAKQVQDATGQHPWPAVNTWPVRLVDTVKLVSIEAIKTHNAHINARSD